MLFPFQYTVLSLNMISYQYYFMKISENVIICSSQQEIGLEFGLLVIYVVIL